MNAPIDYYLPFATLFVVVVGILDIVGVIHVTVLFIFSPILILIALILFAGLFG